MKRTDFFIKLITAVLFLAVACYVGVYVYRAAMNTYVTTPAISYSVEEMFSAHGYIVRTETVLDEKSAAVLPIVADGEKVASGQAVAVEYTTTSALEAASEIRALRLRIAQLEAPGASAESVCLQSVMALSMAVHSGNLSALDELSVSIESNIFTGGASSGSELPDLKKRLETLEGRSAGMRTVYAPVSGVFSQVVDGFERVKPGALTEIMPPDLMELFRTPSAANNAGKLVTEFKWYYAAIMNGADAVRLSPGQQIAVQFSGAYHARVDMRVENIGRREDGECVVLFSCDRFVHDVAPLRYMRADIVFDTVTGIRVPKEAIQLDDYGATFIYLQTGVRAERVDVDILTEYGDSYLVSGGADAWSPLREGAEIIVKANGLYDGKIVR